MSSVAVRAGALVALLAAVTLAAVLVDLPDLPQLRAWIMAIGPAAPAVFTLLYALAVLAPVPKGLLSTAAGLAFGVRLGVPLVLVGATAGAVLAFGVARLLGRDAVRRHARGRAHRLDDLLGRLDDVLRRRGVLAALVVRFVPLMPFTLLNYGCGLTAMRLRHYTVGTAVALIPGTCAMVVLGSAGGQVSPWLPIGISLALALVSLTGGLAWQARHSRRSRREPAPQATSTSPI
jgi:uncharacterized membrane protein YdjX (TVP38/TMEM64 family)